MDDFGPLLSLVKEFVVDIGNLDLGLDGKLWNSRNGWSGKNANPLMELVTEWGSAYYECVINGSVAMAAL